jgi:putative FmdB family regulatory protein
MPIFEYECQKCGAKKEIFVSTSKYSDIPICEKCKEAMKRILSKCTFSLIGPGWAKDGYNLKKD